MGEREQYGLTGKSLRRTFRPPLSMWSTVKNKGRGGRLRGRGRRRGMTTMTTMTSMTTMTKEDRRRKARMEEERAEREGMEKERAAYWRQQEVDRRQRAYWEQKKNSFSFFR